MELVSIICPIYNEIRFVEKCIDSILHQDYPIEAMELLLVDGMSTDGTRDVIAKYAKKYTWIHLLDNPHHTAPYAMNIGIRAAKGEYICRIDAHSIFSTNYVSTLLNALQTLPNAANVGAVCKTLPANESRKAQAIALACSNPLGVGNSTFRISTVMRPTRVDTVPFGFWRKSIFDEIGLFDEELTRNQDDELNARITMHGGYIYLVPTISTAYYSRENIAKVSKMFYQYGLYKPLVNKKIKRPVTIRQFVPFAFVLGLIIGLPLAFINTLCCWIYLCCIALYITLICSIGLRYKNAYLPLVFCCIHVSYGWGYIRGLLKLLFHSSFDVQNNR